MTQQKHANPSMPSRTRSQARVRCSAADELKESLRVRTKNINQRANQVVGRRRPEIAKVSPGLFRKRRCLKQALTSSALANLASVCPGLQYARSL